MSAMRPQGIPRLSKTNGWTARVAISFAAWDAPGVRFGIWAVTCLHLSCASAQPPGAGRNGQSSFKHLDYARLAGSLASVFTFIAGTKPRSMKSPLPVAAADFMALAFIETKECF